MPGARRLCTVILLVCILPSGAVGVELKVNNDTDNRMKLWIKRYGATRWIWPPVRFLPGDSKIVLFESGVEHQLVFMDYEGRQTYLGWRNVDAILHEHPDYELSIRKITQVSAPSWRRYYLKRCRDCGRLHWFPVEQWDYQVNWGPLRSSPD